ncbi:hypothetical protein VTN31DRAFT_2387 [Thermomyces dupontii]|uniref:uncharacterized protein n=1 Tax=Talaromyces thermophilus TaxID=28565 RepID=UPI0037442B46
MVVSKPSSVERKTPGDSRARRQRRSNSVGSSLSSRATKARVQKPRLATYTSMKLSETAALEQVLAELRHDTAWRLRAKSEEPQPLPEPTHNVSGPPQYDAENNAPVSRQTASASQTPPPESTVAIDHDADEDPFALIDLEGWYQARRTRPRWI